MADQTFELYTGSATGTQIDNAAAKVAAMEETLSGTAATIPSSAAVKNYVDSKSVDTKEETANKVTSISPSSTDTQYPSAKAVVNTIGKCGVISQKQTWTSDYSSYTMSDIVIGIIPQSAIDLYEEAGATFNENGYQTGIGYFEMNGITDLSYQNIKDAYDFSYHNNGHFTLYFSYTGPHPPRTNFPLCNGVNFASGVMANNRNITLHLYYVSGHMEVLRLSRLLTEKYGVSLSKDSGLLFYYDCNSLREVMGVINVYNVSFSTNLFFTHASQLRTVKFHDLHSNISLIDSSVLSLDSVVYMVQNRAETNAITITLHPDVYAVCQADTTEYTYQGNTCIGIIDLATAKNITIASA